MSHLKRPILGAIVVVILAFAGCSGGDGLPREPISGTVSLDGEPLESGSITFMPADASSGATAVEAAIKGGAFAVPAEQGLIPGPYRVTVSAPVAASEKPARKPAGGRFADSVSGAGGEDAPAEVPLRESIPARYNAQSTLTADVAKGARNAFDFPLTSK